MRSSWAVGEPDRSLSPPVLIFVLSIADRSLQKFSHQRCDDGEIVLVRTPHWDCYYKNLTLFSFRKFEHSETFGLIASASSNAIWAKDEQTPGAARQTGAGRAIVGASEEVLCWDVKKGELLGRWRDSACRAQVTVVTQSQTDEDIFAVG
jgi:hypothetical protein